MTKRRKWSSEQKLKIVLEGLSGQIEISKLCNKYQIFQLLPYGHQAFESKNITKQEKRLSFEDQRLKQIIGDLTIELKKSEFE